MIEVSEVYEWGWGSGDDDGCHPNCNYPQVLAHILTNEGLFNQAYWSTLDVESEVVEVPEPGTNLGILALFVLASSYVMQSTEKKQRINAGARETKS